MYPHRIRLRGPWTVEPLARALSGATTSADPGAKPLPAPRTMQFPFRVDEPDWTDFVGRVRLTRRFGSPRQLEAHERVWLTYAGSPTDAQVRLNGIDLGIWEHRNVAQGREVTPLLREHNQLEIETTIRTAIGHSLGEVALEIRCAAWLHGCEFNAWHEHDRGFLRVSGDLMGEASGPLDLYVILGRFTVIQGVMEPAPEGRSFAFMSEPLAVDRWRGEPSARLELVRGSAVWWEFEQSVVFRRREESA